MDQIVVPAAAGQGPQLAAAIERFKNNPGVVGEATNNPKIDLDELSETSDPKRVDDPIEFLAPAFAVENLERGLGQRAELHRRFLARFAFTLVDDLQRLLPFLLRHI